MRGTMAPVCCGQKGDPSGVLCPAHLSGSRTSILLVIAAVCALPLIAEKPQEPNRPKYFLSTESKMKATVQEVKLPANGSEIAHLLVKIGADTFDVYLCPKAFLDDMGVNFSQGEEIVLTGSRVKQGEAELILARRVVRGNDTLVLRDKRGNPVYGVGSEVSSGTLIKEVQPKYPPEA